MLESLWQALTPEVIAGAIVGFSMLGVIARNVITGWHDAMKKVREAEKISAPMATAFSVMWDKDQIERGLQALESMAKSSAIVAASQTILSDKERAETKDAMEQILDRLDIAERNQRPPSRPKPRKKP